MTGKNLAIYTKDGFTLRLQRADQEYSSNKPVFYIFPEFSTPSPSTDQSRLIDLLFTLEEKYLHAIKPLMHSHSIVFKNPVRTEITALHKNAAAIEAILLNAASSTMENPEQAIARSHEAHTCRSAVNATVTHPLTPRALVERIAPRHAEHIAKAGFNGRPGGSFSLN